MNLVFSGPSIHILQKSPCEKYFGNLGYVTGCFPANDMTLIGIV